MSNSPQPKWDPPNNPLICLCFTVLCWVSVGDESLKPTWEAANPRADPDKWAKYRKRIVARITSITVVVSSMFKHSRMTHTNLTGWIAVGYYCGLLDDNPTKLPHALQYLWGL